MEDGSHAGVDLDALCLGQVVTLNDPEVWGHRGVARVVLEHDGAEAVVVLVSHRGSQVD